MCLTDVEAKVSLHRADRQGVKAAFGPIGVKPASQLATNTNKHSAINSMLILTRHAQRHGCAVLFATVLTSGSSIAPATAGEKTLSCLALPTLRCCV